MLRDLFSLFPAYAGVIPEEAGIYAIEIAFPRICGGDPSYKDSSIHTYLLFPAYAGVIP